MKRYLLQPILFAFLVFNPLGSGEIYADDQPAKIAEMQATINAQASEIAQLKRERDKLKSNVDQASANVQRIDKEEAELKTMVARLEKELASCRRTNR
jgi:septal ring factor EnvC (AmiA/AmiB activator)